MLGNGWLVLQHLAELTNKQELEELTLKITVCHFIITIIIVIVIAIIIIIIIIIIYPCPSIQMLDQRVVCLSAVHPTLASRLTQKQTEVRDRWHCLLEGRR